MTLGGGSKRTKTKSAKRGKRTSVIEVLSITPRGVWLLALGKEYFADYEDFPWFKEASVAAVFKVKMPSADRIYWPDLDIDLAIASLDKPSAFPLVSRAARSTKKK